MVATILILLALRISIIARPVIKLKRRIVNPNSCKTAPTPQPAK